MFSLLLFACSGETPVPEAAPPPEPAAKLEPAQIEEAIEDTLAPSPNETRLAVERAGISLTFGTLIPDRNFKFDRVDEDRVALRTGVLLSDLVLAVKEAEKPWVVDELQKLHDGLSAMGAGEGLLATVLDLKAGIDNDSMSRDDLLKSLDDIVGMGAGQGIGADGGGERMMQAGAWLAGTNMTARAILRSGQLDAADSLLRQKSVAEHFLAYVTEGEGQEKAGELGGLLEQTLQNLIVVSDQETIGRQDIEGVRDQTQALIDLL